MPLPQTVGPLRDSGYRPVPVKEEMRRNLLRMLRRGEPILPGLVGYDDTVTPQVVHAVLARHDLLLLGTRGQGKTRLLRRLVDLLDEAVPALAGCDLRDDPLAPVSEAGRRLLAERGDEAPVVWIGREDRYGEKLATPDASMADLFGDIDLMKHVQGRSLSRKGRSRSALSRGRIAACSASTSCPTSARRSRSASSTCCKSGTCKSGATPSDSRSTCASSSAPTPKTTRAGGGS